MAARRDFMGYIGTGAIGGIVGYYVAAKELLGIQSETETPPPETETPPPETETPPPETGSLLFEDPFTTENTGYDPEKWSVIKKTRFEGEDVTGTRFTQTENERLRIAPQSYESVYLESSTTFSPPVELTIDIANGTPQYGSAADLGFAMPGETYPGRGGERSGRGRMFKWTTDSVNIIYNKDGKIRVLSQKNSPLHNNGDSGDNQSGDGSWNKGISNTTATLMWTSEEVRLSVGDDSFSITENIPTDPMPLYLTGIEWVGSEAVDMTLNGAKVTQL